MSFALGRKCYVRNWTVTKFCDIGTGDFPIRPKMEFRPTSMIFTQQSRFQSLDSL